MNEYWSTTNEYRRLIRSLVIHGAQVQVGPEMTTEIAPFVARFLDPRQRLIDPPGRNLNFAYCVVEALDILMNKNPGLAPKFVKRLENWMVDGKFPGHYGIRMHIGHPSRLTRPYPAIPWQLQRCYAELHDRPTSRRATVTIHNPVYEDYHSKDVACTMDLQFLIRDGKLHCIAHMRSNDLLWGFCYDTWLFQFLQESMAAWLQVELGYYYHIAGSLHFYHERHKAIDKILARLDEKYTQNDPIPMMPTQPEAWAHIIKTMWNAIEYFCRVGPIGTFEGLPEPFNSYLLAVKAEIARKRRLRETCQEIFQKMPKSDVSQWVKRRCKLE